MTLPTALGFVVAFLFVIPVAIGLRVHRIKVVLPVALLVTVGASFWLWTGHGEVQVLNKVESVKGNQLVVSYTGSECEGQRSVSVDEDDSSVQVKIVARTFASACSDVGAFYNVVITLDEPLGSRKVGNVGCTSDRAGCKRVLRPPPSKRT